MIYNRENIGRLPAQNVGQQARRHRRIIEHTIHYLFNDIPSLPIRDFLFDSPGAHQIEPARRQERRRSRFNGIAVVVRNDILVIARCSRPLVPIGHSSSTQFHHAKDFFHPSIFRTVMEVRIHFYRVRIIRFGIERTDDKSGFIHICKNVPDTLVVIDKCSIRRDFSK